MGAYESSALSRADIDATPGPLVLEFGASWCGICSAAQPCIEEAFRSHPSIPHLRIADGRGYRLGRSFQVKLWPTLIFLKDGKEVSRVVRPTEAAVIREALANLVG